MFDAVVHPASETTSTVLERWFICGLHRCRCFKLRVISSRNSAHPRRPTQNGRDYEPFEALEMGGPLVESWIRLGAVFDSAFAHPAGR